MTTEIIDIKKIMSESPINRLTGTYQSKLLNKIKEKFTNEHQQLFVGSFYMYLNYENNEFIVDLDNIWTWVGFERKEYAVKLLKKRFNEEKDYIIDSEVFASPAGEAKNGDENRGGKNKVKYLLTIKTFKKYCLKANTKKANTISEYFIDLEEIVQETINEQSKEMRECLFDQKQRISKLEEENDKLKEENREKEHVLYAFLKDKNNKSNNQIKFGKTTNIISRERSYKTSNPNTVLLRKISCENIHDSENWLFDILKRLDCHIKGEVYDIETDNALIIMDFVYYMDKLFGKKFHIERLKRINEKMDSVINDLTPMEIKFKKETTKNKKNPVNVINGRSKGKIISRDLKTGEEVIYNNKNKCPIDSNLLKKSLLDKPKQAYGKHWRTFGKPYWIPPQSLVYDDNTYESSKGYIRSYNAQTGEIRIYESTVSASKFLGVSRRRINTLILENRTDENGLSWSRLPNNNIGTYEYSELDSNVEEIEQKDEEQEEQIPETDEQKLMRLFVITDNDDDRLHVSQLKTICKENDIKLSTRLILKFFVENGAIYYNNKTKISINGKFACGYSRIKAI